ncbi:MAG: hypothetical protein H6Q81_2424 [Deltaproteobacteria bacterium]|nr:hypothetical protein [Deltaproteobacteria bacterium]
MSDDRSCSGGVLLAFIAGGMVGAGLALLYAPASGRETRERISGLAEDLKKKSEEWTGEAKQKVERFIDVRDQVGVRSRPRRDGEGEGPLREPEPAVSRPGGAAESGG